MKPWVMKMKLTRDNYHSREANKEYMSVSQFKSFLPEYNGCEAKTMAKLNGEWEEPENPAFLLGSYVHAWNSDELQDFMANTPELFKKSGGLYAKYAIGDDMINALKNDEVAMEALAGQKEVIMTGELFGLPWKIMIDSYNPEMKTFTDLKTTRAINKTYWNPDTKDKENFIVHWGYDVQLAIYAEIERQNRGEDEYFMPHILAVSKEDPPDKELIKLPRIEIEYILDEIEGYASRIELLWRGKEKPIRCEECEYCRETKKIKKAKHYMDVGVRKPWI